MPKLKIGGHDFEVKLEPEPKGELVSGEPHFGSTNYNDGTLTINASLTPSQQESTLIHEIFHVLVKGIDHVLMDSLSEQLYQVFRDNNLFNVARLSEVLGRVSVVPSAGMGERVAAAKSHT